MCLVFVVGVVVMLLSLVRERCLCVRRHARDEDVRAQNAHKSWKQHFNRLA